MEKRKKATKLYRCIGRGRVCIFARPPGIFTSFLFFCIVDGKSWIGHPIDRTMAISLFKSRQRACAHISHVNRNKYSTPFLFRLAFACFFFFFFHLQNSIENTFCLYSTSFFLTFVSICLNRIGR